MTRRQRCHTPDDAYAAGWADGRDDPPLTDEQVSRLVALHAPYLRPRRTAA